MTLLDKIINVTVITLVLCGFGVVVISFLDQRPSAMRFLLGLWSIASLVAALIWTHEEAEQIKQRRGRK